MGIVSRLPDLSDFQAPNHNQANNPSAFNTVLAQVRTDVQTGTEQTNRLLERMRNGMSLEMSAEQEGLTRERAVEILNEGGYRVETTNPMSDNGDVRTTRIIDPNTNNTITEYYDFQHDGYHIKITEGDETTETPTRDGGGRLMFPDIPPAQADHGRENGSPDATLRDYSTLQNELLGDLPEADRQALANDEVDVSQTNTNGEAVHPTAATLVTALENEILYTTQDDPIPSQALSQITSDLKNRHPGDETWAAAVDRAADRATRTWEAQGRTEEVLEPLYQLADPLTEENATEFENHVKNLLAVGASTEPTVEAVERWRDTLLRYGPQDARSQQLIRDATHQFLVTDPQEAAAEVQAAYDSGSSGPNGELGGAAAAAQKLAELTELGRVDPLSAALIAEAAQPTIERITTTLAPYDQNQLEQHSSTPEATAALDAFTDLSVVMNSIGRSPEGQTTLQNTAAALKNTDLIFNDGFSPLNKFGVTLSLEIASQLRADGRTDVAAEVEQAVLGGIENLEERMISTGEELGELAAPMVVPETDWQPFLSESEMPENWFDDQETLDQINSKSNQLNQIGIELELSYQAVERYAPSLEASPHGSALLEKGNPAHTDPKLTTLLDSSPGAMAERLRMLNQAGLGSGALDMPTIVPDGSWPTRMLRNSAVNGIEAATGSRPKGTGLALFGLGTYTVGVLNKTQEGGVSNVTAGLYFAGGLTEAWAAMGYASTRQLGWTTTSGPWWQRAVAAAGEGTPAFQRAFNAPLRALGWWNAYNAAASLNDGKIDYALLHGFAAGGIFAATRPFSGAANPLHKLKWFKTGGNIITLLASTGLMLRDMHEQRRPFLELEERHRQFLEAAGFDPALAEALAKHPNDDGLSVAGRLSALAELRGVSEQEVMEFLRNCEPREVFELVNAASYVEAGEDGSFPIGEPSPAWETKPPSKALFRPMNIAELNQFIEHYMPDFPGQTPS